jgi:hypothetical protein
LHVGLLGFGGLHDVEQSLEESSGLSRMEGGAILRALLYQVINDYASVVDGQRRRFGRGK